LYFRKNTLTSVKEKKPRQKIEQKWMNKAVK
jgi:hypothetical protein